jgi:hypothetical protein
MVAKLTVIVLPLPRLKLLSFSPTQAVRLNRFIPDLLWKWRRSYGWMEYGINDNKAADCPCFDDECDAYYIMI